MMADPWRSIDGVCEVSLVRGSAAAGEPTLLLEVPHGATRAEHFRRLRAELVGSFPDDLEAFFFVNTDVGAPELALRVAERVVALDARRSAVVVRCLIPRTFVDCNRVIESGARGTRSAAGQMTPGVHAWVREPADLALLLERYDAYRASASAAYERVCGADGLGLMVHSYAPRSVDVPVDERIVEHLRAAYAPERVASWPLRAMVDLIADTPDGQRLASEELVTRAREEYAASGFDVALGGAYALHPSTLAHAFALRHPRRKLCLELRRDLLVREFTPFAEMQADRAAIDRAAEPLAQAALGVLRARV